MRTAFASVVVAILAGSARAVAAPSIPDAIGITPREAFLAVSIAAMIGCSLIGFLLAGRVSQRTHVALAMLVVLIGAFSLLALLGPAGGETPIAGGLILVGLIGLFKLMNQFEIQRRPDRGRPVRPTVRQRPPS